jgi:hypothetical protein
MRKPFNVFAIWTPINCVARVGGGGGNRCHKVSSIAALLAGFAGGDGRHFLSLKFFVIG